MTSLVNSARIAASVASSMSSSLAISLTTADSSDEIAAVGGPDHEARAHDVSRCCSRDGRELAGHDEILGPADALRLQLGHLDDEDRGRLIHWPWAWSSSSIAAVSLS